MFGERKPGWPFTPALLQVYVDNVDKTLALAQGRGAEIVTRPTDFFGDVFARFIDPWRNMWWVWSTQASAGDAGADASWDEGATGGDDGDESGGQWQPTPELTYIHETLLEAFPRLQDPHA